MAENRGATAPVEEGAAPSVTIKRNANGSYSWAITAAPTTTLEELKTAAGAALELDSWLREEFITRKTCEDEEKLPWEEDD
jgi:hypothetical protein